MPVPHVDVQNGSVTNGPLTDGSNFKWSNSTTNDVNLTDCGGFCVASSYTVPKATAAGNSTVDAKILAAPTSYTFTDPAWNAPGQPRITVNPWPTEVKADAEDAHEKRNKEVA